MAAKSFDIRLGQYLIQKRACTLRQVNEAMEQQRELRTQAMARPLGGILVEKGYLRQEQLYEALADLGQLELRCPGCNEVHAVASYNRDTEYRCPRCRSPLVLEESPTIPTIIRSAPLLSNEIPVEAPAGAAAGAPAGSAAAAVAPREGTGDPMISKVIGGCQILDRIAKGGMGVVYKARQLNLGRTVAIKILSEELSQDSGYVERFIHEARSAAVLSHGNIVHIIDVGEHNGIYFIIMEYVDGKNLREILLKQSSIEIRQVLLIGLQVSQALQHAHRRGIIHRDIKPENIMITRDWTVKLADLGLAKKVAGAEPGGGLTHAGAILGTPFYMAPEQAKDFSRVDQRSDIYSLGVTLYKALTGKVPFDGRTPIEAMIKAIEGKRLGLRELRPEIPIEVEAMVDRMMHRLPEERFQEAGQVITAIEVIMSGIAQPAGVAVADID